MRYAAFFRNLLLGRAGHPTRAQFIAALDAAGAREVVSLQAHGNAAFSAGSARQAAAIAGAACEDLRLRCGWRGTAHVRSMARLAELIDQQPFAAVSADGIHERCVTFLPAVPKPAPSLPIVGTRGDLEIFRFDGAEAFSVTRLVGSRPGNVNALLERLLQTPLTTRNWNTVVRVVERCA